MIGQNTSSAVMQQRREPHKSLDDFPTPPWATRALVEWMASQGLDLGSSVREPAANRGHMVKVLVDNWPVVDASDVHDYGAGFAVSDYLFGPVPREVDWTITNPPFRLAEEFIARAMASSRIGCAFLVRSAFLEGVGRHERVFSQHPPRYVLQFAERVVMHKGTLTKDGSTATAYCWVVFTHRMPLARPTNFHWIAPARKRLERASDYDDCEGPQDG